MRHNARRSNGISRVHITILYVLMGSMWVLLSYDTVHKHLTDPAFFFFLRGLYISLSAAVIHYLMYRMDRSRRTSEREYHDLVTLGHEPIVVCVGGIIREANEYAQDLLGAENEDIVGHLLTDFIQPDERLNLKDLVMLATEAKIYEMEFRRLDGLTLHLGVTTIPAPHLGESAVHLVFKDRSAQVRAEDALQSYADIFRVIEENISDYICVLDQTGRIVYSSPSLAPLVDNTVRIHDGYFEFWGIHPDDHHKLVDLYTSSQEHRRAFGVDVRTVNHDGSSKSIEVRGVPILSGQVGTGGMVVVARDITDRQNADRLLRQTERLNVVAELAAAVAHEIRNPLTIVRGFLQLDQLYGKGTSEYLELMLQEVDKVETIISEFLMMAEPEPLHLSPKEVGDLLALATPMVHDKAMNFGVRIETETMPNLPRILCHEDQMKQVFVNILDHAIESMTEGGTIRVIATRKSQDTLSVKFIDEGSNVDDREKALAASRIFTTKSDGTGLGLIVCQRIIESHDGKFLTYGRSDRCGTVVELVLPTADAKPNPYSSDIVFSSFRETEI